MTTNLVTAIAACRVCGSAGLRLALEVGPLRVSGFPPVSGEYSFTIAPLDLVQCPRCLTVQLQYTVAPEILFQGEYWYASGINGTMREELRHVVRAARQEVRIHDGDWVLDIGANDGTLISAWRENLWEGKPNRMAVEPATTFRKVLGDVAEAVVTDLFPSPALAGSAQQFKVITSIAMFYAVADPVEFAREIARLLTPDGVWIVQMQDLEQMMAQTAIDNLCHEHLIYYTPYTLGQVCQRAGLQIVQVETRAINGGSLRFTIMHAEAAAARGRGVEPPTVVLDWGAFSQRINQRIGQLQDTVAAANDVGHTVDLLGASTKGNTLLQLAGLGPAQIRRAWERHPKKIGRTTITGIPIVGELTGRGGESGLGASPGDQAPTLLVCPIWQFRDALIEREEKYLRAGGRIYFPLPVGELYLWGGR